MAIRNAGARRRTEGVGVAQLQSIATALPPHVLSAEETKDLLSVLAGAGEHWEQIVDASRILRRHLVVPVGELLRQSTLGERARDYTRQVIALGEAAAGDALVTAGIDPKRLHT